MENNTDKDKNNQARATTEPFTSINNTASTSGTVKENATELSHDKSGLTFGQHTTTKSISYIWYLYLRLSKLLYNHT